MAAKPAISTSASERSTLTIGRRAASLVRGFLRHRGAVLLRGGLKRPTRIVKSVRPAPRTTGGGVRAEARARGARAKADRPAPGHQRLRLSPRLPRQLQPEVRADAARARADV